MAAAHPQMPPIAIPNKLLFCRSAQLLQQKLSNPPDGQELLVRVDETRSKLEYHDQKAIENQGPLSSITVGTETNDNGTQ